MPTWTFQTCFGRLGQVAGNVTPTAAPVRDGPRHCGQSWAGREARQGAETKEDGGEIRQGVNWPMNIRFLTPPAVRRASFP